MGPHNKANNILRYILGSPYLGKVPHSNWKVQVLSQWVSIFAENSSETRHRMACFVRGDDDSGVAKGVLLKNV